MNPARRRLLVAGGFGAATLLAGGGWLLGPIAVPTRFASLDEARRWLATVGRDPGARTRAGWSLARVLEHAAQSVDYSIDGYPRLEPAWFRASVGALAFRAFARRGSMRHDLDAAIPGAPALVIDALGTGVQRLDAALARFDAHRGPLAPHFAYGSLDRHQYTAAHLMHLADHARRLA